MPSPMWRFREKQRAEVHQDSANTEFFAQQDVAERLVREAAQNTMDATSEGETARLVLTLTTVAQDAWEQYFKDLWPHLEAQPELRESLPDSDQSIPCLLVEDFGTTGLTGPLEPEDRKAAEQQERSHRLFWFFKNVGRTSKTGEQLGSFGIGKTVFPYSSRINSFFGYSVRAQAEGDHTAVLLGQSQLREHRLLDTGDLDPYGFFSWHDGKNQNYVQRAISEPPLLDDFRVRFGLRRENQERGLSVVIPYPESGLSCAELVRAAITQFFFPILSGQLEIEIVDGDPIRLSADTLLSAIDKIDWKDSNSDAERLRRRVRLARWAIQDGRTSALALGQPQSMTQPQFESSMIDTTTRTKLSQQFISGNRLALRVPVPIEPKSVGAAWSYVEVFLEYDRKGMSRDDIYVRKGLTLVDHTGQARQAGLCAILVAEDRAVYEMLRSSENVAHTAWRQRGAARLTQQYDRGAAKIKYVLGIIPALIQLLLSPEDEADWWTLADLFPEVESSPIQDHHVEGTENGHTSGPTEETTPTEDDELEPTTPLIPLSPQKRIWRAKATKEGLQIEGNPGYEGEMRPLHLTAAYGILNRRKFSAHDSSDFSFLEDPQMITVRGAVYEALEHNSLKITPTDRDFMVYIKGFDPHRALDYQVKVENE